MEMIIRRGDESPEDYLRRVLLDALDVFYCPLRTEELAAYITTFAQYRGEIPQPADIVEGERRRAHGSLAADVWLCHGLGERPVHFEQDFLARSDWDVGARLVVHDDEQSRQLWLLRIFCDAYLVAMEKNIDGLATLELAIKKHVIGARPSLPADVAAVGDSRLSRTTVSRLREAAEDAHAELAASEEVRRANLAKEYEGRVGVDLIFGGGLT